MYDTVIGLEIHAQLNTNSKLFCRCATTTGAAPNSNTCPVCFGLPGALPATNKKVVELAIRLGLATHCDIRQYSQFARKNYFYPDLPKAYQISQYDYPICENGWVEIDVPADPQTGAEPYRKRINLTRIHIEEDAGKLVHDGDDPAASYVDLNRAGVPLVEIVSEPDLSTPLEARTYMETMHTLVTHLGVSKGNMEQGNLRADANVSLKPANSSTLGTRTETKNLNSFRFLQAAVTYEIQRQTICLTQGESIRQETRLYDSISRTTHPMRSKEEAHDYRYFPDPDLPPVVVSDEQIATIQQTMPELPTDRIERYQTVHQLSKYDARLLVNNLQLAGLFDALVACQAAPKPAANWVMGSVAAWLNEHKHSDQGSILTLPFQPQQLADLINMAEGSEINSPTAKKVFEMMCATGEAPAVIIDREGWRQVSDEGMLQALVTSMIAANPDQVAQYKAGKDRILGYLVGQIMKQTKGQANPKRITQLLQDALGPSQSNLN